MCIFEAMANTEYGSHKTLEIEIPFEVEHNSSFGMKVSLSPFKIINIEFTFQVQKVHQS